MKKFISATLALIMILCTITTMPILSYAAELPNDAAGASFSTLARYTGVDKTSEVAYSGTKYSLNVTMGSFGLEFATNCASPYKDDVAYKIDGTATGTPLAGQCFMGTNAIAKIATSSANKYISYSADVFFETENSAFYYRFKQQGSSAAYNLYVGTAGASAVSGCTASNANFADYPIPINQWHNITFVIGANGTNNMAYVLVDGVCKESVSLTSGSYGMANAPNGYFSVATKKGSRFSAYIDNINLCAGDNAFVKGTSPALNSASPVATIENNILKCEHGTKVSDIKGAISVDRASYNAEVYDFSRQKKSDDAVLENTDVLVVTDTATMMQGYYGFDIHILEPVVTTILKYTGEENISISGNGTLRCLNLDTNVQNVNQREAEDAAFYLHGTATSNLTADYHASNIIDLDLDKLVGAAPNFKYMTVSFDFLLQNDGNGISFRMKQEGNSSPATYLKFTAGSTVNKNEWYNAAITYCIDGSENTYDLYLNGQLFKQGNTLYGGVGVASTISAIIPHVNSGEEYGAYIDNINVYKGEFDSQTIKPVEISSSVYEIDDNNINGVYENETVGGLFTNINTSSNIGRKMVLDKDYNVLSNTDCVYNGSILCTVSNTGIYNYKKISAQMADFINYTGTKVLKISDKTGGLSLANAVANASLKPDGDYVYELSGTTTADMSKESHGIGYFALDYSSLLQYEYNTFAVSVDFNIQKENTGFWFRCKLDGNSGSTSHLKIMSGTDVNAGEWNRAVILFQTKNDVTTYTVYINGKAKSPVTISGNAKIASSAWIVPYANNGEQYDTYFDNISIKAGTNGIYSEVIPSINGFSNKKYNFDNSYNTVENVSDGVRVSELLASVDAQNVAKLYVCDENGNELSDNVIVPNRAKLVLVSTSGIYRYYTIDTTMYYKYTNNIVNPPSNDNLADYKGNFDGTTSLDYKSLSAALADANEHGSGWYCTTNTADYKSGMAIEKSNGNTYLAFNTMKVNWEGAYYILPTNRIATGNYTVKFDAKLDDNAAEYAYVNAAIGILYYADETAKQNGTLSQMYSGQQYRTSAAGADASTTKTGKVVVNSSDWKTYTLNYDICNKLSSGNIDPNLIAGIYLRVTQSWDATEAYPYGTRTDVPVRVLVDNFKVLAPEEFNVQAVKSDEVSTLISTTSNKNEFALIFNRTKIYPSSVNADNIYFEDEKGNKKGTVSFKNVYDESGEFLTGVVFSVDGLDGSTNYTLNVKDLMAYNETKGDTSKTFGEGDTRFSKLTNPVAFGITTTYADDGKDKLLADITGKTLVNDSMSNASVAYPNVVWFRQGGAPTLSTVYDNQLKKDVYKISNRANYTAGVQQYIYYYDEYHDKTGDEPGKMSVFNLSYKLKSDTDQYLTVALKWYISGKDTDEGSDSESIYNETIHVNAGEWKTSNHDIKIMVPESMKDASHEKSYLRIFVIGNRKGFDVGDFYMTDFKLSKWYIGTKQYLDIDEDNIVGAIPKNAFGYSYENGNGWNAISAAGTVSKINKSLKQTYLDFISEEENATKFDIVRIGGFSSNYELWKRSLGDPNTRTAYCYPRPKQTQITYSTPASEYIGMVERVKLAKTYNPDNKLIICLNAWSAEPDSNDMTDETGTLPFTDGTVYPVKIMRHLDEYGNTKDSNGNVYYDETLDERILEKAIDNALDEIRFWTCEVDDPRAIGSDGINWAQKRVENGFENPIDVYCWELGNEFYIRHCSAAGYINIANYFIDAIRNVFPEEKIAVHCTGASYYPNWMIPIVEQLGPDVDYITTHNYYTYSSASSTSVESDKTLNAAIKNTGNENLKFLITEGGMNTFLEGYSGPSNRSLAMSISYADFFNNIVKLDRFDGFQYFGSTGQLAYNEGRIVSDGWYQLNSEASVHEDPNGEYYKATNRKIASSGFQHKTSLSKLEEKTSYKPGENALYNLSFKYKFESPDGSALTDTPKVRIHWVVDGINMSDSIADTFLNVSNVGTWNTATFNNISIRIPKGVVDNENSYLRVVVYSSANSAKYYDIYVRDLSLKLVGSDVEIGANTINVGEYSYDIFKKTALAEVFRYYMQNCRGDICSTQNSSDAISSIVSTLAVKTHKGIRLFMSNISETTDYTVYINTNNDYRISSKFFQTADSIYSERNQNVDNITTVYETYESGDKISSIVVPKSCVMIVDLEDFALIDESFTANVIFGNHTVHATGTNSSGACSIIAGFYNDDDRLLDSDIKEVSVDDTSFDLIFTSQTDYTKVKLFKWQMNNYTPLASCEVYILSELSEDKFVK